jgi:hypothetical protein
MIVTGRQAQGDKWKNGRRGKGRMEGWKNGRMEEWNDWIIDLPGFEGQCAEKPVRSDELGCGMTELAD